MGAGFERSEVDWGIKNALLSSGWSSSFRPACAPGCGLFHFVLSASNWAARRVARPAAQRIRHQSSTVEDNTAATVRYPTPTCTVRSVRENWGCALAPTPTNWG